MTPESSAEAAVLWKGKFLNNVCWIGKEWPDDQQHDYSISFVQFFPFSSFNVFSGSALNKTFVRPFYTTLSCTSAWAWMQHSPHLQRESSPRNVNIVINYRYFRSFLKQKACLYRHEQMIYDKIIKAWRVRTNLIGFGQSSNMLTWHAKTNLAFTHQASMFELPHLHIFLMCSMYVFPFFHIWIKVYIKSIHCIKWRCLFRTLLIKPLYSCGLLFQCLYFWSVKVLVEWILNGGREMLFKIFQWRV